jgi:hypothetical protein
MASEDKRQLLFLRALVLLGIILFAFFMAVSQGYVQLTLDSDSSYLSYIILIVYVLATLHWLYISWGLSKESTTLAELEGGDLASVSDSAAPGEVARYFNGVRQVNDKGGRYEGLLEAFGDRIINRHAAGHFIADTLLKLGLLGTIIGFILMLLPVAEIKEFEANLMQQMLGRMSAGMAVALYTTLAGLITSTLLKLQYQILDSSAARLITRVTELSELRLVRPSSTSAA